VRKLYLVKITKRRNGLTEEAEDCSSLDAFKNWLDKHPAGMRQG